MHTFSDTELEELLKTLWYIPYHFKGVPSRELRLAKRIRDAVEAKFKEIEDAKESSSCDSCQS